MHHLASHYNFSSQHIPTYHAIYDLFQFEHQIKVIHDKLSYDQPNQLIAFTQDELEIENLRKLEKRLSLGIIISGTSCLMPSSMEDIDDLSEKEYDQLKRCYLKEQDQLMRLLENSVRDEIFMELSYALDISVHFGLPLSEDAKSQRYDEVNEMLKMTCYSIARVLSIGPNLSISCWKIPLPMGYTPFSDTREITARTVISNRAFDYYQLFDMHAFDFELRSFAWILSSLRALLFNGFIPNLVSGYICPTAVEDSSGTAAAATDAPCNSSSGCMGHSQHQQVAGRLQQARCALYPQARCGLGLVSP
jgi:hypothetical protein